jgi:hypothetical protein
MRMAAFWPTRSPTGEVVKVGFGSTSAVRRWPRERQLTALPRRSRADRTRTGVRPKGDLRMRAFCRNQDFRKRWALAVTLTLRQKEISRM